MKVQVQGFMSNVATVMAVTMMVNSATAFAAARPAGALEGEVRTLRASIDGGTGEIEKAVDAFAAKIIDKNITLDQVHEYMKSRTTAREYREYRALIDRSLKGVDPATLKSEEVAQLLTQAMGQVRSDGLSWSGCTGLTLGAIGLAIAVIVFIVGVTKQTSDAEVKKEFEERRRNSTNSYNNSISDTHNWQTSIPRRISDNESNITSAYNRQYQLPYEINSQENRLRDLEYRYYNTPDAERSTWDWQRIQDARTELDRLHEELRNIPGRIAGYQQNINRLREQYARYSANPGLVALDAADLERRRDQAIVDLNAQEVTELGEVPGINRDARSLRIGAAVGGAIGAYFLVDGIVDGGC
jgi:hypothetical protein